MAMSRNINSIHINKLIASDAEVSTFEVIILRLFGEGDSNSKVTTMMMNKIGSHDTPHT